MRALVIGAGFGGLAIAVRLLARGFQVEILERNDQPGGRARRFQRGDFLFDAGPTVITAPFLFDELFELFDEQLRDSVTLLPVEPWYRMSFPDGRTFDYGGTVEETCAEIAKFSPGDVEGYRRLLAFSERLCQKGFTELAHRPFTRFIDMLRVLPDLIALRADRSVTTLVARYLRSPELRKAFSIQPLLVGGNPFETSSLYSLIHALERRWGIWYPIGGTQSLVQALVSLFCFHGGQIRYGSTVRKIDFLKQRTTGVQLEDGSVLPADLIVANADPASVYTSIAPEAARHLPRWKQPRRMQFSMGLYVLYFATKRCYPEVAHHTILFGESYRQLLREIFYDGTLSDDPSLYLHRPAATDPSMAPPGTDTFYVLAPVPNLKFSRNWEQDRHRLRDLILTLLEKRLLPELRKSLVLDFDMTPMEFESELLSPFGAGFSISPILRQSAWFRYHNRAPGVSGLYFVGAGVHPGAGVPGVLSSAKVTEHCIAEDYG